MLRIIGICISNVCTMNLDYKMIKYYKDTKLKSRSYFRYIFIKRV